MTEKLLSRDPLTDLRRAFKLFDVDGTGVINLRDLRRVAKELGENLGEEELCVPFSSSFSFPTIPPSPFLRRLASTLAFVVVDPDETCP